uniref:Choline transporter-like protein n=1 Tax=Cyprinus carpio carpio TaxID=630221 RepID=A0A8C1D6G7_CYPCA
MNYDVECFCKVRACVLCVCRSCTDIICCVLFMLVIAGYIVVGILAWLYGDPRHVLYPRNSTGMFCGIGQNKDKPNVMYFDIVKCATATNVMAAALQGLQCPTTQVPDLYFNSFIISLRSTYNIDKIFIPKTFCDHVCVIFNLIPLCVCVSGLVIAMVVSVFFLLLLRFTAPVLIWVLIIGVLAVGAFGIWYCYNEYMSLSNSALTYNNVGFTTNVQVYLQVRDTWLAFLIILSIVEAVLLLALIFLRTRILIAIALIQETSKALGHMMSTLFYPIVTFVLLLVCVSYWGITALYPLHTSRDLMCLCFSSQTFNTTQYPTCPSARCVFINYNTEGLFQRNLFNLQIYNVFAFLWCVNFVIALGHCTLAGTFASYYWAFSKPADIPTFPLIQSFMRALRYHVGSLAFGALILTLVQIVRIILEYLDHKFKEAQNPCTRFIMCCLKCCFYCLEKFIKFINRNAYIMIAIYGKNFCVSAKNAFSLLMRNIIRVVVLDKVTDLLLFFGKLLVVGGVGVLAFFFFSGRIQTPGTTFETAALNYYWMPIITVVFGAYLIAHGFFSVYNMGVDTLFLCFLEDLERNDGSPQKPYFMSKNLMKILNKKNKPAKTAGTKQRIFI